MYRKRFSSKSYRSSVFSKKSHLSRFFNCWKSSVRLPFKPADLAEKNSNLASEITFAYVLLLTVSTSRPLLKSEIFTDVLASHNNAADWESFIDRGIPFLINFKIRRLRVASLLRFSNTLHQQIRHHLESSSWFQLSFDQLVQQILLQNLLESIHKLHHLATNLVFWT